MGEQPMNWEAEAPLPPWYEDDEEDVENTEGVSTDALILAMERALRAFGAHDILVTFREDAPEGRGGMRIAFYPSEFAYKVGMFHDG